MVEWKLVATKSFENFSYVGVSPIPQLVYTNLAWNHPICLGPQALICVLFKTKIFVEKWEGCKSVKKWLHIILRKWDFNSKDSKWVFGMGFLNGSFEKSVIY